MPHIHGALHREHKEELNVEFEMHIEATLRSVKEGRNEQNII